MAILVHLSVSGPHLDKVSLGTFLYRDQSSITNPLMDTALPKHRKVLEECLDPVMLEQRVSPVSATQSGALDGKRCTKRAPNA